MTRKMARLDNTRRYWRAQLVDEAVRDAGKHYDLKAVLQEVDAGRYPDFFYMMVAGIRSYIAQRLQEPL